LEQARAPAASTYKDAYVSIRQHTSAYVSIRQHTPAYLPRRAKKKLGTATLFVFFGFFVSAAVE
jgi:hypothetical protein